MVINTIPTDPKNSCFGGPKAIRRYGTRRLGTTTFPGFVLSGFQSRNVIATFSATFLQLVLTSGQKLVNNSMVEKLLVDREASNRQKRSKPSKKRAASAFDAEDSENSFLADPDEPQVFQKVQDLGTRSKRTKKPKLVETTNTGPVTKLVEATNVGPVTKRGRGRPKKVMLQ